MIIHLVDRMKRREYRVVEGRISVPAARIGHNQEILEKVLLIKKDAAERSETSPRSMSESATERWRRAVGVRFVRS